MTKDQRLRNKNDALVQLIEVDSTGKETVTEPTTGVKKIKLYEKMSAKEIKLMIEKAQSNK